MTRYIIFIHTHDDVFRAVTYQNTAKDYERFLSMFRDLKAVKIECYALDIYQYGGLNG